MPTGYTAGLADGTVSDFKTFALQCARAFGATIMQRDDPMNELPKLREVSTHYEESLAKDQARVLELAAMSEEDATAAAQKSFEEEVISYNRRCAELMAKEDRYKAMRVKVVAWRPPSNDHAGLKTFMLEQIDESLKFDCGYTPEAPKELTGAQWLNEQRTAALSGVSRSAKYAAEERERVAKANEWITKLYESVSGESL